MRHVYLHFFLFFKRPLSTVFVELKFRYYDTMSLKRRLGKRHDQSADDLTPAMKRIRAEEDHFDDLVTSISDITTPQPARDGTNTTAATVEAVTGSALGPSGSQGLSGARSHIPRYTLHLDKLPPELLERIAWSAQLPMFNHLSPMLRQTMGDMHDYHHDMLLIVFTNWKDAIEVFNQAIPASIDLAKLPLRTAVARTMGMIMNLTEREKLRRYHYGMPWARLPQIQDAADELFKSWLAHTFTTEELPQFDRQRLVKLQHTPKPPLIRTKDDKHILAIEWPYKIKVICQDGIQKQTWNTPERRRPCHNGGCRKFGTWDLFAFPKMDKKTTKSVSESNATMHYWLGQSTGEKLARIESKVQKK